MIVPLALTFDTNGITNGTIGGSTIGGTLTDIGIPLVELEAYSTLNPDVPIYIVDRSTDTWANFYSVLFFSLLLFAF